jgi:hypothetical protein
MLPSLFNLIPISPQTDLERIPVNRFNFPPCFTTSPFTITVSTSSELACMTIAAPKSTDAIIDGESVRISITSAYFGNAATFDENV